ncbi:MAG: DUF5916 domain-containing protein [Acidobacteriota bacterium]
MLFPFLCGVFLLQQAAVAPAVIEGKGSPAVSIPRIEAEITVDGKLDEPPWGKAVHLTGFWQYTPVDGRLAQEPTEVLVWYSPTALYFGIIAHDSNPDSIRATVGNRDNLDNEDKVTIYLDTFNDKRRAFFFTVNALGVQEDGVRTEGAPNAGQMYGVMLDKSPDYKWDSKGSLTEEGYVVEVRIPFKSLRYPGSGPQRWGFNALRKVQRTGYEETWTDTHKASNSFLGQFGLIEGMHDLKRGVVVEAQPFVTAAKNGARTDAGDFQYTGLDVNPGVNLRLAFPNISVDATINPDFSQVESDAGLVTVNQRFALYYPEKRPFFLEGIELFSTPNQLVYTRQIVDPIAGGKVTGKIGPYGIAYLTARDQAPDGDVTFNIARVRRDIGMSSIAGLTFTDRTGAGGYNRVAAADMRYMFGKLYYIQGQVGGSWTETPGLSPANSPLWSAEFDRTGRAWGFNYKLNGIGENFTSLSGYVPRNNIVEGHAFNRYSYYGEKGALVENVTVFFSPQRYWRYQGFGHDGAIEGTDAINATITLRNGWIVSAQGNRHFVRFDPDMYKGYSVQHADGTIEKYAQLAGLDNNFGTTFGVTTPVLRVVNASLNYQQGDAAIFPEAAAGNETTTTAVLSLRPTDTLRFDATNTWDRITRARNNSEFARTIIPRLKIEYQPRRSFFFRVVAEYRCQRQAALEHALTGEPLIVDGVTSRRARLNGLRIDVLASYLPTPGTVAYIGYGSSLQAQRTFGFSDLERTADGFFVKLAYLFRR